MPDKIELSRSVNPLVILGLIVALLLSMLLAVCIGEVQIPMADSVRILMHKVFGAALIPGENTNTYINVIWFIRMPRMLLAVFAGAGLTLTGIVMQATLQNALADPYILGISSGATLGATLSIMLGAAVLGSMQLPAFAFLGALLASMLIFLTAGAGRARVTSVRLILTGQAISLMMGAFSNLLIYLGSEDTEKLRNIAFWMMGSLAGAKFGNLPLLVVVMPACLVFFLTQTRVLNAMLVGDETAISLGIPLHRYRRAYMIICALITGSIVAYCGIIGFVGFIIPHIVRGVIGANHKRLIPVCVLCGSIFLVWADVIARTIIQGSDMPIGIVTAMAGSPVFVWMLVCKRYEFGSR